MPETDRGTTTEPIEVLSSEENDALYRELAGRAGHAAVTAEMDTAARSPKKTGDDLYERYKTADEIPFGD